MNRCIFLCGQSLKVLLQPLSETCSSWVFFITVHQSLKFPPWGFVKYYFRCYEVFLHAQLVLYLYIRPLNVKETQITFFSFTRPRHHLQFYVITTCRAWVARVLLHNTAEWLSLQFWLCHCCGLHSHPRASQLTWVSSESCLGFVPNISIVTVAGQNALISACPTFLLLSSLEK